MFRKVCKNKLTSPKLIEYGLPCKHVVLLKDCYSLLKTVGGHFVFITFSTFMLVYFAFCFIGILEGNPDCPGSISSQDKSLFRDFILIMSSWGFLDIPLL